MITELNQDSLHKLAAYNRLQLLAKICILVICTAIITGCASKSGGYYKDDGPHSSVPANIASIPNATPKIEQHRPANFRPYSVFGVRYTPIPENEAYKQKGIASWYGKKFHGNKTANGEIYDMYSMTAAHPTLPLPSYAKVTRPANGRSVIVRINDRGPFHANRIIDLSYAAAAKLGIIGPGSDNVIVQAITNNDIQAGNYDGAPSKTTEVDNYDVAPIQIPTITNQDNTSSQPAVVDNSQPSPTKQIIASNFQNSFYLQFGAFASSTNAQALAERISRQSGESPEVTHQADLYKVRLGPYQDRYSANQAADNLQNYDLQPTIAIDFDI